MSTRSMRPGRSRPERTKTGCVNTTSSHTGSFEWSDLQRGEKSIVFMFMHVHAGLKLLAGTFPVHHTGHVLMVHSRESARLASHCAPPLKAGDVICRSRPDLPASSLRHLVSTAWASNPIAAATSYWTKCGPELLAGPIPAAVGEPGMHVAEQSDHCDHNDNAQSTRHVSTLHGRKMRASPGSEEVEGEKGRVTNATQPVEAAKIIVSAG